MQTICYELLHPYYYPTNHTHQALLLPVYCVLLHIASHSGASGLFPGFAVRAMNILAQALGADVQHVFGIKHSSGIAGYQSMYVNVQPSKINCFPKWFHFFTLPTAVYTRSHCFTPSPTLEMVRNLNICQLNVCKFYPVWWWFVVDC